MFAALQKFFLPKNIPEDEKTLAILFTNILLATVLIGATLSLTLWADNDQGAPVLFVVTLVMIAILFLAKTGLPKLSRYIFIFSLWLAVSFTVLTIGSGVKEVQILGYPLIIVLGTLLLGDTGLIIFTSLSALSYGIILKEFLLFELGGLR
jgi:hypothetical protein